MREAQTRKNGMVRVGTDKAAVCAGRLFQGKLGTIRDRLPGCGKNPADREKIASAQGPLFGDAPRKEFRK